MSATNKGFVYIFNPPCEDRKVARVLGGWGPDETLASGDIAKLDSRAQEGLAQLQERAFSSCCGHDKQHVNTDPKVLAVLVAALVRHYPRVKALNENAPLVRRLEESVVDAGYTPLKLLAWSSALAQVARAGSGDDASRSSGGLGSEREATCETGAQGGGESEHYAAIVAELSTMNKKLAERLRVCELALLSIPKKKLRALDEPERDQEKHDAELPLVDLVRVIHSCSAPLGEQRHSDARLVVAYMRLFLRDGFLLQPASASYKDDVLASGTTAEVEMLAFLRAREIKAASYGTVLRETRKLHRACALNAHIKAYRVLLAAERVLDPSPPASLGILTPRISNNAL